MFNEFKNLEADKYIYSFEEKMKAKFDAQNVIAVSSGTAALHLSLACMEISFGDEVLVPAMSVIMSVLPVVYQGAKPVFYDFSREGFDIDYDDLEKKITKKTKAIIVVYMWGRAFNWKKLESISHKYNIPIIEDACQAQGTKWEDKYLGNMGILGCFSLKTGKILATGEGGYIFSTNDSYTEKIRYLRNHCTDLQNHENSFNTVGWNYRISAIQAYLGCNYLNDFDATLKKRKDLAMELIEGLALINVPNVKYFEEETPNYYSPIFYLPDRYMALKEDVFKKLSQEGVLNSVGSFGFLPANERKSIVKYMENVYGEKCNETPNTKEICKNIFAPVINDGSTPEMMQQWVKIFDKITSMNSKSGIC